MELETFMVADAASAAEAGKLYIHGGGVSRLNPPRLPWLQPQLAIVTVFRVEPDDLGQVRRIGITLNAPTGDIVGPAFEHTIGPIERPPTLLPGEDQRVQLVLTMSPVSFPRPGTYRLTLAVDGRPARGINIAVAPPRHEPGV